jgi:imidazole glycerol phosphate synthase glutamine amidotransferase subunit
VITVVDYGAGNAVNVKNALLKLGVEVTISDSPVVWQKADAIVFPGVGSFGAAIENLGEKIEKLRSMLNEGKSFLGICLGMQLLMDESEESPGINGFGLIQGRVKRFDRSLPVPQIGWNKIERLNSPLFNGMEEFNAYFVNSYYCDPIDNSWIGGTTDYGMRFASAFWKKNIYATQFHPEKSGEQGLQILKNFVKEVRR